jgi:hypothetical protein
MTCIYCGRDDRGSANTAARDAEIKDLKEKLKDMADDIHKLVTEIHKNCPKDQIVKRWIEACDYHARIALGE